MNKTKRFLFILCLCLASQIASAQDYNVDYENQTIEQVIRDLRKITGFQFVYKKETLDGVPSVTCSYKNATLQQLLERVLYEEAGLDYEIANGTIILKKSSEAHPYLRRNVIGVVTDIDNVPLPGATIRVKGTQNGVITDLEGEFSIVVEGYRPVIEISYVGMKPQEIRISSRTERMICVKLEADLKLLEGIIVTGYHNIKRENATGSYQLISSNELERRYTGDVVSNLEGMVPGLVRYNNGFNDGGESALTIRGAGSFNANTTPLVVVDGLPIEGGLQSVNPYNIGSITVLKDAAAASIYGARASNGVIVITSKRAKSDKLEVNFSADLTVSEKNDYDYLKWADASELIQLERYNFNFVKNNPSQSAWQNIQSYYKNNRYALSPIVRLLTAKEMGMLTTEELNSQLEQLSRNDYRKEWQDLWERPQIIHQYNLALRNRGKYINSSLVVNFKGDNIGVVKEHDNILSFSYRGDMSPTNWLALEFGTNVINQRTKQHIYSEWNSINSFAPYLSMYNSDGSLADMEAGTLLNEPSLLNNVYGLKSEVYNLNHEVNRNFTNKRHTNIRSFVHAKATLLEGLTVGGMFQYEDIYQKSEAYREAESYDMRHLYNLYTSTDGIHYLPNGGELTTRLNEGAYYTFRTQTDFNRTIADRHLVEALAGFEFRQSQFKTNNTLLMGYDEQSQTNNMGTANMGQLKALEGSVSALGSFYSMYGAPSGDNYVTSDILHRFYSVYFNGNYTFDSRYSLSTSYRVDKADLFGADPKFRGRPLWSVGLGWNMHNQGFMKDVEWVEALKLRTSYGLTGNIAQDFSSYLTATVGVNELNGVRVATLDTPPNEQLRWEKTASFNIGTDFALFGGRLTGTVDYYHKNGSDLLTMTDLDPTTGWSMLTINNGKMVNRGIELQLNGEILRPRNMQQIGLNVDFNIAYNKNEVTSVNHEAATGAEALQVHTLHQGYPVHSLFSYRFAGMKEIGGIQHFGWYDANDVIHYADINTEEFTTDDVVYSGSLEPKVTASLTPQLTWSGFTLSAMFAFYGGHVMRARVEDWTYEGSAYGYKSLSEIAAVPKSYLNYWTSTNNAYPANGYAGSTNVVGNSRYIDANVVPADYIKLRNIVLGYDFPKNVCQQLHLQSLRLRIQANNLLTWTRNSLGVDPESCFPTSGEVGLKTSRSYTMSLNVNF